MQFCSGEAGADPRRRRLQRGTRSERVYREAKVFMIGGAPRKS
jgi:hypothetical protein